MVQCSGTSDGLVPATFYSYSEALRIVFVSVGLRLGRIEQLHWKRLCSRTQL
jgi:hypothetical protein